MQMIFNSSLEYFVLTTSFIVFLKVSRAIEEYRDTATPPSLMGLEAVVFTEVGFGGVELLHHPRWFRIQSFSFS